jgi:hypothetical protein
MSTYGCEVERLDGWQQQQSIKTAAKHFCFVTA